MILGFLSLCVCVFPCACGRRRWTVVYRPPGRYEARQATVYRGSWVLPTFMVKDTKQDTEQFARKVTKVLRIFGFLAP